MKSIGLLVVLLLILQTLWSLEQLCLESQQGMTRIEWETRHGGQVLICNKDETSSPAEYRWFQVLDSTWNVFGAEHVCNEAALGSSNYSGNTWGSWAAAANLPKMNGSCLTCPMRHQCDVRRVRRCYGRPAYVICNLSLSELEGNRSQCDSTQVVKNDASLTSYIGATGLTSFSTVSSASYVHVNATRASALDIIMSISNLSDEETVTGTDIAFTSYFPDQDTESTVDITFTSHMPEDVTSVSALGTPSTMTDSSVLTSRDSSLLNIIFPTVAVTSTPPANVPCILSNTTNTTFSSVPIQETLYITVTPTSIATSFSCTPSVDTTIKVITTSVSCEAISVSDTTAPTNTRVNSVMNSTVLLVPIATTEPMSTSSFPTTSSSTTEVSVDSGQQDQCNSLGGVLGAMIVAMAMIILLMLLGWIYTCHRRKSMGQLKEKKRSNSLHSGIYATINNGINRHGGAATLPSTSSIAPIVPQGLEREDSVLSSGLYDVIRDQRDSTEVSNEGDRTQTNNQIEVIYHVLEPEAGRIREASVFSEVSESDQAQDYEIPLKIKITPPSEEDEKEEESIKL